MCVCSHRDTEERMGVQVCDHREAKEVQDVCISAISGRHGMQAYVCSSAERPEKECEGCVQL